MVILLRSCIRIQIPNPDSEDPESWSGSETLAGTPKVTQRNPVKNWRFFFYLCRIRERVGARLAAATSCASTHRSWTETLTSSWRNWTRSGAAAPAAAAAAGQLPVVAGHLPVVASARQLPVAAVSRHPSSSHWRQWKSRRRLMIKNYFVLFLSDVVYMKLTLTWILIPPPRISRQLRYYFDPTSSGIYKSWRRVNAWIRKFCFISNNNDIYFNSVCKYVKRLCVVGIHSYQVR